jgi:hypothetical protein
LNTARPNDGERLERLYAVLEPVLHSMPKGQGQVHLAGDIAEKWEENTPEGRWVENWVGLELCQANEAADEMHGETLGRRTLDLTREGVERVADWAKAHYPAMPKHFKAGFRARLTAALSGGDDVEVGSAEQIAAALSERATTVIYGNALKAAVEAKRFDDASRCLARASKQAGLEAMGAAVAALEAELPELRPRAEAVVVFVLNNQTQLDAAGRERLAERLVDDLVGNQRRGPALAPIIAKMQIGDAKRRAELVGKLLGMLAQVKMPRWRMPVIEAADGLAGSSGSARELVDEEIRGLAQNGQPAEKKLAEKLITRRGLDDQ